MSYGIYFDSVTSPEALRSALHILYDVPTSLIYVGPYELLKDHPGPDPIALITDSATGQFRQELSAGDALAERTGATELELAQAICRLAHTRALVEEGSPAPDYWFLVAADGSYGRVKTDPDTDGLIVLHAREPIPAEPDLPVEPPPDWAKTWRT
jgi:hypothetical protein